MTTRLRQRVVSGATLAPTPQAELPNLGSAEEFYSQRPATGPQRQLKISVSGPEATPHGIWYAAWLEDELNQLLLLQRGWDGHRAAQVTRDAVVEAGETFFLITDQFSILPQFFPLPDGGIQFEWHVADASLEVAADGSGAIHALAVNEVGEVAFEGDVTRDDGQTIDALRFIVRSLSARATGRQ